MSSQSVVVLGTGHAGVRAAEALRKAGWDGAITIVGEEADPPYQRPPVSKALLFGPSAATNAEPLGGDLAGQKIELHLGRRVEAIERPQRRLILSDGTRFGYDRLVLAPGSAPRQLDFGGDVPPNLFHLRSAADARALRPHLTAAKRLLVIGGGLIGLEVAAGAATAGLDVTVLEAAPKLLSRAVPEMIADRVVELHRRRGVTIRAQCSVRGFTTTAEGISAILNDGMALPCDLVLVCAGAVPRIGLAQRAGLDTGNGILTDAGLLTSDPAIYAAGDVCNFPHPLFGVRLRLESQQNAEDQGRYLGKRIMGDPAPFAAVPWFWSDQFDSVLQIASMPGLGSQSVARPLPDDGICSFHLNAAGQLVGAAAFGSPELVSREIGLARRLIGKRASPAPEILANAREDLRAYL
jgi:3-phenylpropionate/trans-cinnamate dioxygenase ferredoxin reductase component